MRAWVDKDTKNNKEVYIIRLDQPTSNKLGYKKRELLTWCNKKLNFNKVKSVVRQIERELGITIKIP